MQELVFSPRHSGDPGHPHYMWASNKKKIVLKAWGVDGIEIKKSLLNTNLVAWESRN